MDDLFKSLSAEEILEGDGEGEAPDGGAKKSQKDSTGLDLKARKRKYLRVRLIWNAVIAGVVLIILGLVLLLIYIIVEPAVAPEVVMLGTGVNSAEGSAYHFSDQTGVNGENSSQNGDADAENGGLAAEVVNFAKAAQNAGGDTGVIIYDISHDATISEYQPETEFEVASLYKLFVVYAGYMMVDAVAWQGDEVLKNTGEMTISEALDAAIRSSDSDAAEAIWKKYDHTELNKLYIDEFGYDADFNLERISLSAAEILKIMQIIYEHKEIKDISLVRKLNDSLLNQPAGEYDWRQGLPKKIPDIVKVYNKVGWRYDEDHWAVYNDAALLDCIESGQKYIVVVLTKDLSPTKIADFGQKIAEILAL
ncbi:serine hydrolase [Candidatus Saccharibacteria bacterium]|nr:serine hydrolase [Candidatus Saccharibacteria bacterium]